MLRQHRIITLGFYFLIVFGGNPAFAEEDENLTEFGDAMQFILPLTAWGGDIYIRRSTRSISIL
jgi:hypothetical protein